MGIHHDIEFMKLRKKIRKAQSIGEKIEILEQIVSLNPRDPKNLTLRKKYKEELKLLKVKKRQKKKVTQSFYEQLRFKKQAILVGETNTGKSTLLPRLTGAKPAIGDFPFTTYKPEIGMMNYKDVAIQIIELPSLYRGGSDKKKYRFIRNSDVSCICIRTREQFNFVKGLYPHGVICAYLSSIIFLVSV